LEYFATLKKLNVIILTILTNKKLQPKIGSENFNQKMSGDPPFSGIGTMTECELDVQLQLKYFKLLMHHLFQDKY